MGLQSASLLYAGVNCSSLLWLFDRHHLDSNLVLVGRRWQPQRVAAVSRREDLLVVPEFHFIRLQVPTFQDGLHRPPHRPPARDTDCQRWRCAVVVLKLEPLRVGVPVLAGGPGSAAVGCGAICGRR